ncbi:MAG: hypothetical protein JWQ02_337 [Capsulimonas sp.]|nr:hypothetical protein [Capsulimonas sp.]
MQLNSRTRVLTISAEHGDDKLKPRVAIVFAVLCCLIAAGGAIVHNYSTSRQMAEKRSTHPGAPSAGKAGNVRKSYLDTKIVWGPEDQAALEIRERKAAQRRQASIAAAHAVTPPVASAPASELVEKSHKGVMRGLELVTVEGQLQFGLLP